MGRVVGVIAVVQPQPKRHLQTWECSAAGNREQQLQWDEWCGPFLASYNNIQILHFASRSKRQQINAIVDHQTMFASRTEQTIFSKLGWRSLYALYGYTYYSYTMLYYTLPNTRHLSAVPQPTTMHLYLRALRRWMHMLRCWRHHMRSKMVLAASDQWNHGFLRMWAPTLCDNWWMGANLCGIMSGQPVGGWFSPLEFPRNRGRINL